MSQHQTAEQLFAGNSEMAGLMRSRDWSQTSLGAPEQWSQSLKTAVRIMLTSRQAMFVWWGEELINLYNDAYKAIVGGKHPAALGQPASVVWQEIWEQVGPRAESTMFTNEGTYDEALLLIMERNGYPEETYYTFSYSPIPDDQGNPGGIICANTDDTQRIISERQLALLQELAARTADARTFDEACTLSARCLETNPYDLPFAMIYLVDAEQRRVVLAGTSGIESDHPAVPATVNLDADSVWSFAEVLRTQRPVLVGDLVTKFDNLPTGAWERSPHQAVVVPIAPSGQTGRSGILVAGLNPFRLFDDSYRSFINLVAGQISASVANANAYEEERKRAEALAELDRAKTTFFSNVSHEFRTPLTLMLSPLEETLTNLNETLPPREREQLQLVQRNGMRLLKLVNSLLDFSRIEAGRGQAAYEPTDLATYTAELASTFRSLIERAGMSLVVECLPLPEAVYVDREMWEKIVLNLLSNAFKFTLAGSITVRLQWLQHQVELSVADTGVGIPAAELPHLFERFHRVENSQGRSFEGSGIGLSLVQELVKLHSGTIVVTSTLGQGSCFTVTIPTGTAHLLKERINASRTSASTALGAIPYIEEAQRWLPEAEHRAKKMGYEEASVPTSYSLPPTPSPTAHILLADDNADMRDYIRRLLSPSYTVQTVADGAAALQAIQSHLPNLVLTDVMMPGMDGFELLRLLRTNPATRDIPIILLSARAGEESRIEGLEAGADDYLIKPFSARELIARIEATLKLAQLRREAGQREQVLRLEAEAAREAAENANRIKDEFLAVLSHELRSPLNPILGWSKLLQQRKLDVATTKTALATIERNAQLQVQLIEDLLDISRILRGKLSLNVMPVNLHTVISAALETVRLAAEAKSLHIQTTISSNIEAVMGDAARLQQVIWNLLSNAVKFTPPGGQIDVRLEQVGNSEMVHTSSFSTPSASTYAQVQVIDTGKGINPDFLPHVFEHFRQEDGATTRKFGGLGLGLAIVRQIVELHGGTVTVDSRGEGQGATFTVQIPLAPAFSEVPSPTISSKPTHDLSGLQILVVDDEVDSREFVVFVLEQAGAIVTSVSLGTEALQKIEQLAFNLIVSDIGMPDLDGYMLLQRIRGIEHGKHVAAIALTAYAGEYDQRQAIAAGFQQHMPKPIDPEKLVSAIRTLCRDSFNSETL